MNPENDDPIIDADEVHKETHEMNSTKEHEKKEHEPHKEHEKDKEHDPKTPNDPSKAPPKPQEPRR